MVTVDAPMVAAMDGCYTTVATMGGAPIKSGALRGAHHARSVQAGRRKAPAARRSRRARVQAGGDYRGGCTNSFPLLLQK